MRAGVAEQPRRDRFLLVALLLELRHTAQLAERRDPCQQPGCLGMRADLALDENGRTVGFEARGEQHRGEVECRLPQLLGVIGDRDRVQVDDAEEGFAELLGLRVLAEGTAVVAEVLCPGGLDAAEDAHLTTQYRNYP